MSVSFRILLGISLLGAVTWGQTLEELARRKMEITDSLNQLHQMGLWPPTPPPGTPIPLTLSESDCPNAVPVCQQTYTYTASPPNFGTVQELGSNTCLLNREQKTAWFIFTVQNSGTFGFIINTTYDYDFALFNYGAIGGCAGTATATPVRCNYSAQYGNTGLDANNPQPGNLQWNASQPPIMPGLNVTAGQTYILVVDNWTGNATGFTITFTGTAQIFDNNNPTITSIQQSCTNPNQLIVTFSEPVRCNSLHPSDFNLGASVTVTGVSGTSCGTFTTQAVITFTGTLNSGVRTLTIQTGTDGNTIRDVCNNQIPASTTFNFQYLAPPTIAGPTSVCAGTSATLTVNTPGGIPTGATISWNTGANTASINVTPSSTTTYTVSVTYGGCTRSATHTITLNAVPTISVSPNPAVICSGTAVVTGTTTIGGGQWQYDGGSGWTNTANPMNLAPGTYQIRYQSPSGCFSNTVSLQVATAPPPSTNTCNVIYVTPGGSTTAAGTKADPTNLTEALTRAACSNTIIKMATGTYTFNGPITGVTSNITIEGGFDQASGWRKTSQPGATTIVRTGANVEGCSDGSNAPRLVAFQISNASNFRLQDLTITVDNAPAASASCASGRGVSTYAVHLSNCSNYNIVRCRLIAGNAGAGLNGTPGAAGYNGGAGGAGGLGHEDEQQSGGTGGGGGGGAGTGGVGGNGGNGSRPDMCFYSYYSGGSGGGGGAGGGGAGGRGGDMDDISASGGCGWRSGCVSGAFQDGANATTFRAGGGGGGGGSGSGENNNGCPGGNGGNGGGCPGSGGCGATGGGGGGGCGGCSWSGGCEDGAAGAAGANGANAAAGSPGPAGSISGGWWVPGGQGVTGGDGAGGGGGKGGGGGAGQGGTFCTDGAGAGGGGGGGGGSGGAGGTGGWGGGSCYGLFLVSNGAAGNVVDCFVQAGSAGAGGTGGTGGTGGFGGAVGLGATGYDPGGREIGFGGNGGAGGNGGNGGAGGSGQPGEAQAVRVASGVALATSTTNFNFSIQPIITVADIACTGTDVNFATGDAAPHSWNFGAGATPATSTSAPVDVQYSSTGRKNIQYDGQTYTGFWNILIPNAAPTITPSATSICVGGTISFTTNLVGISYTWQVASDAAFTTIVATGTTQNYSYTFTTADTFYVRHRRSTDCCGNSPWSNVIIVTVHPLPAAPTASGTSPVCRGAGLVFTATAPAGVTFEWYTAATGGTLAGTGSTLIIPHVAGPATWPTNYTSNGIYTLYVEAVSAQGCRSARTPVTITVDDPVAPTTSPVSRCGSGPVVLTANYTGPGTPTYNWWNLPTGGTLVQTGGSNTFTVTVTATTTFYVSVQVPGCVESARVPVTATVNAAPPTDTWTGTTNNDWFNPGNWASGCVPNCGTTVTIPAAPVNQPQIGWNPVPAACNGITIAAGASLTFTAVNAQLDVCGNFTHTGVLNTAAGGRVRFIGSGVQTYVRAATATGNFYQVIIDKPAASLANRRVEVTLGNMTITNQLEFVTGRIATLATNAVVITNSDPVSVTGHGIDNYIQGRLQRAIQNTGGLYALPVGDVHPAQLATGKGYQLAEIALSNPTNVTALLSFFTPTPQTIPATPEPTCGTNYTCAVDNGFWTINLAAGNALGTTYDLTLYPRTYTTCNTQPYHSIMKREGVGPWYLNGTCCATSSLATGVCRNGFNNGFSDFVVVGSTTPLPIASLTLQAQPATQAIQLRWEADAEDNVRNYQLLRGEALHNLQPLTQVTATAARLYQHTDRAVQPGVLYYYQVVAIGPDGQEVRRSNAVQAVLPSEAVSFAATLQPNPTRSDILLYLQLPEADRLEIEVVNALGQAVWRWKGDLSSGLQALTVPAQLWAKGVYLVRVQGHRYEWSGRFVRE